MTAWEEPIPAELEPLLFIRAGDSKGISVRTDAPGSAEGERVISVPVGEASIELGLDERETAALGAALAHTGALPDDLQLSGAYERALRQSPLMTVGELRLLARQLLDLAFNQALALAKAAEGQRAA